MAPTETARFLEFDAIQPGDRVVLTHRITEADVDAFLSDVKATAG